MDELREVKHSNQKSQKIMYHNRKILNMENKESNKYNIPNFEDISNNNYQILINIFEPDHIKLGI